MQAIKEKLHDMSAMRKAKAEAKEEEKAHKDLAKARMEIAHEVRLAREAEAAMDIHVNRAAEKAVAQEMKHPHTTTHEGASIGMPTVASACPDGFDSVSHDDHGSDTDKQTPGDGADAPPTNLLH